MKTFIKTTRGTILTLLLCIAFICGAFALFGNTNTTALHMQSEVHEHDNQERGVILCKR